MRAVYKYESTWLAGLLFPFKLYVVLALVGLLCWHAMLPREYSDAGLRASVTFDTMADFLASVYIFSTVVLITSGVIQVLRHSERAAIWSFGFGLAALIIGMCLFSSNWSPIHGIEGLSIIAR